MKLYAAEVQIQIHMRRACLTEFLRDSLCLCHLMVPACCLWGCKRTCVCVARFLWVFMFLLLTLTGRISNRYRCVSPKVYIPLYMRVVCLCVCVCVWPCSNTANTISSAARVRHCGCVCVSMPLVNCVGFRAGSAEQPFVCVSVCVWFDK